MLCGCPGGSPEGDRRGSRAVRRTPRGPRPRDAVHLRRCPVDPRETDIEGPTGTDDPPDDPQQIPQQSGRDSVHQAATACDPMPRPDGHESASLTDHNSFHEATLCDALRDVATPCEVKAAVGFEPTMG